MFTGGKGGSGGVPLWPIPMMPLVSHMAHSHCTRPGTGPGTMALCILLRTVHTTQGQGMGTGTIGFHTHFPIPGPGPGPVPGPVQCEWAIGLPITWGAPVPYHMYTWNSSPYQMESVKLVHLGPPSYTHTHRHKVGGWPPTERLSCHYFYLSVSIFRKVSKYPYWTLHLGEGCTFKISFCSNLCKYTVVYFSVMKSHKSKKSMINCLMTGSNHHQCFKRFPGFSRWGWGCGVPTREVRSLTLGKVFVKNCTKMKEIRLGVGWGGGGAPPWILMVFFNL